MFMRKVFLLVVVLSFTSFVKAQSSESITEYFDKDWKALNSPKSAAFYRTVENRAPVIIVRDYTVAGKLCALAEWRTVESEMMKDGNSVTYYENGVVKEEGPFKSGKAWGIFKYYYESGRPRMETLRNDTETRYLHSWSETGDELLRNNSGIVPLPSTRGGYKEYMEIEDSVNVVEFAVSHNGMDTVYNKSDRVPEFDGGLQALASFVQLHLKYPMEAQRNHEQGSVFVSFVVRKDGAIVDCLVIKGVSPACDAEALKCVTSMPPWLPAVVKGRAVTSRLVLPIKFTLQEKSRPKRLHPVGSLKGPLIN